MWKWFFQMKSIPNTAAMMSSRRPMTIMEHLGSG